MFEGYYEDAYVEDLIDEQDAIEDVNLDELRIDAFTDLFAQIAEDNIQDICAAVCNSGMLQTQRGIDVVVEAVVRTAEIRPCAHTLLLLVIGHLSANECFERAMLAKLATFPRNCEYLSFLMLRSRPDVIRRITCDFVSDSMFFYFAPEVERCNRQVFDTKMLSLRTRSGDHPNIKAFLALYELLRCDNWKVHKCIVCQGVNPESRAMAIRYDNVDDLQAMAARGVFDVNERIDVCPFERCDFVNHRPTMIQYAAFYGAVKCFKWLLLNGADLFKRDDPRWNDGLQLQGHGLAEFAVAGGNTEIIRLVVQGGCEMTPECLEVAQQFKWHAISEWLRVRV